MKNNYFLFDGGTGTYLQELSPLEEGTFEEYNVTKPEIVSRLHREYLDAGAMGIKTNTFGANTSMLGEPERVREVILAGISLARKEAAGRGKVFASIGPINLPEEEALREYKGIVDIFLEEGVENFLFETFPEGSLFQELGGYIKEKAPKSFIITSFAVYPSGETALGVRLEDLIHDGEENPYVDVLGLNCISGPRHLVELVRKLPEEGKPLSLMPNAGYPTVHGGRTFFGEHPGYFAKELVQGATGRVRYFGGCCGTTPAYTAALKEALKEYTPDRSGRETVRPKLSVKASANPFYEKLKVGEFPVAVEYDPPKDLDIGKYMKNIRYLKSLDVDGVTLADCPVARARIDAGIMGVKIKRETGMTPIVHMTCRDRNINAAKALLMGLAMEGIQNVLLVTGDPIPTAQRDEVKAVFQMNSVRLANFVSGLNEDVFPNPMVIGGALNVNARNFSAELEKAKRKEEAGVTVFYTQPVLSEQAIKNIAKAKEELSAYILGGMIPVVSERNARFMQSEISGITMDEEVLNSFSPEMSREEGGQTGVNWAVKFMKEMKPYVDGYYLITPFHRVELIGEILEKIRA